MHGRTADDQTGHCRSRSAGVFAMSEAIRSAFPGEAAPLAGQNILQIIPALNAGGAERTTVDIAEAIAAAGGRALVATEGGRLVGELQAKGGVWLPFPADSKNPAAMALNVLKLANLCRREGVSLIHARSRAPAWVALGAARRLKLPFVTTYHGSYSGLSGVKVLYNSVMARGDVVIANSHYTADLIRNRHPDQAKDRIRVIHRGTDLSTFSPGAATAGRVEALRRSWGVASHERIILLAARLTAWKGQRVLIEAAALLRDRGLKDIAVVLAGDAQGRTSYERELDSLVAARGLGGIVRRVGHCNDMPAAFRAASVVAVPSVEPEAFGRSAVEAQALGTPVVVTDIGAVPETVLAPPGVEPSTYGLARAAKRCRGSRRCARRTALSRCQRARCPGTSGEGACRKPLLPGDDGRRHPGRL